ncbi:MAG: serine hydrolase domain-containing protein, partial [Planctomycetaceae bacterium]
MCKRKLRIVLLLLVAVVVGSNHESVAQAQAAKEAANRLPHASPAAVGMNELVLERIDTVVAEGLRRKLMPGCVVLIARDQRIVFHRAYGSKRLKPSVEPMTVDTVFDMASITKPVATATSVMKLVELGKIEINAPVAEYIPEFAAKGKGDVTILQLLTHQAGLIPDNSIRDYDNGAEEAFRRIYDLSFYRPPGTKFVYTDVGFILLADVVKRVSGLNVDEFSRKHVFKPLGMTETGYLPTANLKKRAAPTEKRDGKWMQGEVHDPRAFRLGGVAGHAGLFSTADDVAIYAAMMTNGGTLNGTKILEPQTVQTMTKAYTIADGNQRGLGWDKRTGFSYNRGDLLSAAAFGHGGFTGTVLWMDPELNLTFVFLSNRVHPDGKGSVNRLAGRIATLAAASIEQREESKAGEVLSGIDVLRAN